MTYIGSSSYLTLPREPREREPREPRERPSQEGYNGNEELQRVDTTTWNNTEEENKMINNTRNTMEKVLSTTKSSSASALGSKCSPQNRRSPSEDLLSTSSSYRKRNNNTIYCINNNTESNKEEIIDRLSINGKSVDNNNPNGITESSKMNINNVNRNMESSTRKRNNIYCINTDSNKEIERSINGNVYNNANVITDYSNMNINVNNMNNMDNSSTRMIPATTTSTTTNLVGTTTTVEKEGVVDQGVYYSNDSNFLDTVSCSSSYTNEYFEHGVKEEKNQVTKEKDEKHQQHEFREQNHNLIIHVHKTTLNQNPATIQDEDDNNSEFSIPCMNSNVTSDDDTFSSTDIKLLEGNQQIRAGFTKTEDSYRKLKLQLGHDKERINKLEAKKKENRNKPSSTLMPFSISNSSVNTLAKRLERLAKENDSLEKDRTILMNQLEYLQEKCVKHKSRRDYMSQLLREINKKLTTCLDENQELKIEKNQLKETLSTTLVDYDQLRVASSKKEEEEIRIRQEQDQEQHNREEENKKLNRLVQKLESQLSSATTFKVLYEEEKQLRQETQKEIDLLQTKFLQFSSIESDDKLQEVKKMEVEIDVQEEQKQNTIATQTEIEISTGDEKVTESVENQKKEYSVKLSSTIPSTIAKIAVDDAIHAGKRMALNVLTRNHPPCHYPEKNSSRNLSDDNEELFSQYIEDLEDFGVHGLKLNTSKSSFQLSQLSFPTAPPLPPPPPPSRFQDDANICTADESKINKQSKLHICLNSSWSTNQQEAQSTNTPQLTRSKPLKRPQSAVDPFPPKESILSKLDNNNNSTLGTDRGRNRIDQQFYPPKKRRTQGSPEKPLDINNSASFPQSCLKSSLPFRNGHKEKETGKEWKTKKTENRITNVSVRPTTSTSKLIPTHSANTNVSFHVKENKKSANFPLSSQKKSQSYRKNPKLPLDPSQILNNEEQHKVQDIIDNEMNGPQEGPNTFHIEKVNKNDTVKSLIQELIEEEKKNPIGSITGKDKEKMSVVKNNRNKKVGLDLEEKNILEKKIPFSISPNSQRKNLLHSLLSKLENMSLDSIADYTTTATTPTRNPLIHIGCEEGSSHCESKNTANTNESSDILTKSRSVSPCKCLSQNPTPNSSPSRERSLNEYNHSQVNNYHIKIDCLDMDHQNKKELNTSTRSHTSPRTVESLLYTDSSQQQENNVNNSLLKHQYQHQHQQNSTSSCRFSLSPLVTSKHNWNKTKSMEGISSFLDEPTSSTSSSIPILNKESNHNKYNNTSRAHHLSSTQKSYQKAAAVYLGKEITSGGKKSHQQQQRKKKRNPTNSNIGKKEGRSTSFAKTDQQDAAIRMKENQSSLVRLSGQQSAKENINKNVTNVKRKTSGKAIWK